jgi:hypothetical protein
MYVMADPERRLRAEVLLLVSIAESQEEWSGVRVAPDGGLEEQLVAGGRGIAGERWALFEGALDGAVAAELLPDGQAEWLQALAERFEEPAAALELSRQQRASLDRLLERLAEETVAADGSGMDIHAHIRFHDAVSAAHSLGALDDDQVRGWERRLDVLHGHESEPEDDDDEDHSEPLLGFKAVLAGPQERNGKQVTSVECYDGGLVVRCRTSYAIEDDLRDASHYEISERFRALDVDVAVTDDAGGEYDPGGGGGGSDIEEGLWISTWTWTFTPGVTPAARTLTVHLGDERFEFDATGVAERPAV